MNGDSADISRLAKVFLSGFRFDPTVDSAELWKVIQPELEGLCRTLPDDQAVALREAITILIETRTS